MKKLMTLALGMALVFGTVGTTFAAQDAPKKEKKSKGKGKSPKKKKGEDTKKG